MVIPLKFSPALPHIPLGRWIEIEERER